MSADKHPWAVQFCQFASKQKLDYLKAEMIEKVTDGLGATYVPIEIQRMLTNEEDCDQLVEAYAKEDNTAEDDQGKMRKELTKLVGKFAKIPKVSLAPPKPAAPAAPVGKNHLVVQFEKFVKGETLDYLKLDVILAVCEDLTADWAPMEIQTMLTDEDDCDELLEAYARKAKTPNEDMMKMRRQLCAVVAKFATVPKEAAPPAAPAAPAKNALVVKFEEFAAAQADLGVLKLDVLKKICDALTADWAPMEIQTMLTDTDDCDELLEAYARADQTPQAELMKMRRELCALVAKFGAAQ